MPCVTWHEDAPADSTAFVASPRGSIAVNGTEAGGAQPPQPPKVQESAFGHHDAVTALAVLQRQVAMPSIVSQKHLLHAPPPSGARGLTRNEMPARVRIERLWVRV